MAVQLTFFLEQWIWLDKYNTKEICRSFRTVTMHCFVLINSANRIKWFLLKTSVWPFFGRTFLFETISILSSFCFKFLQIIYNIEICFSQDDQLQRINVLWFRKLISELSIVTTCSSVASMGRGIVVLYVECEFRGRSSNPSECHDYVMLTLGMSTLP